MSDLRPQGQILNVDGVERRILFTLAAMDAIQSRYEKTVPEVLDDIVNEFPAGHTLRDVLIILTQDEADRAKFKDSKSDLKALTEQELSWFLCVDNYVDVMTVVFKAYGISMPKADEDDDPNYKSGRQSS